MKNRGLTKKAISVMQRRREAFTRKCLVSNADNNSLLGYNLGLPADVIPTSKPICLNYSLN